MDQKPIGIQRVAPDIMVQIGDGLDVDCILEHIKELYLGDSLDEGIREQVKMSEPPRRFVRVARCSLRNEGDTATVADVMAWARGADPSPSANEVGIRWLLTTACSHRNGNGQQRILVLPDENRTYIRGQLHAMVLVYGDGYGVRMVMIPIDLEKPMRNYARDFLYITS